MLAAHVAGLTASILLASLCIALCLAPQERLNELEAELALHRNNMALGYTPPGM